jgi:hypothetical protein
VLGQSHTAARLQNGWSERHVSGPNRLGALPIVHKGVWRLVMHLQLLSPRLHCLGGLLRELRTMCVFVFVSLSR